MGTGSEGFEAAEESAPAAFADRQQQEKSETTTTAGRQRRDFTAGFLLEPPRPHAIRNTSQRAGSVNSPRNRVRTPFASLGCRPPSPNSNVGQNTPSAPIIQALCGSVEKLTHSSGKSLFPIWNGESPDFCHSVMRRPAQAETWPQARGSPRHVMGPG